MRALLFAFALFFAAQPQSGSTDQPMPPQQRAHDESERQRQASIRINDLADRIQSEADANTLVSEIAALFSKQLPAVWLARGINQRVAAAEYQSVRDNANRIPEQRIVDVWNQYAPEIGAADEVFVTASEIHKS